MNDHLLYLASTGIVAFTCLLVSGLLLSLKTLRESTIPKYRTACKYLALASALVGIGHIFILSSGTDERTIMELFYFPILLISASQALLFTFLLTLLFRGKNVTRRNILLHAMPTIALTVAYTIACLFREDVHTYRFDVWWDNIGNPPLLIRTLTCLDAPIAIVGPKGAVYLKEGCIVAMRHIHMSPKDAQAAGVKDGDIVSVKRPPQ